MLFLLFLDLHLRIIGLQHPFQRRNCVSKYRLLYCYNLLNQSLYFWIFDLFLFHLYFFPSLFLFSFSFIRNNIYHKELGKKSLYRTCNFLFLSYFEKWTCRISKLHLTKLPSRNVPVSTPAFHWEKRVHCSQSWLLSIF